MIEKLVDWVEGLLPLLIPAIIILIVGIIFTKIVTKLLSNGLKKSKIEPTTHGFITSLVRTSLYVFVFIIFLSSMNVPMSSIIAAIGAAGLAIGLALQGSLSNIAGGFIILLTKPFKKGDYVRIASDEGNVEEISIYYTKLITKDNKAVHIPNGNISAETVVNFSEQEYRKLELTFSIDYSNDYKKAIEIIKRVIANHPLALDYPDEPLVRMSGHGDSAITIIAKICVKPDDYWQLKFDMLETVKEEFDNNGISIPYNKLDVNIIRQN